MKRINYKTYPVLREAFKYVYKVEGIDKEWSQISNKVEADYRNINPGKYTFKVKAIGSAQIWSEPLEYEFQILPPWWLTWWAYLLYGILTTILLLAIRNYDHRRKFAQMEVKRLSDLDQYKSNLYANLTHEFRTPLTIISGMVSQIKNNPQKWYREGLEMIDRSSKRLLNLINQMLDMSKLESGVMSLNMQRTDVVQFLIYLCQSFQSFAMVQKTLYDICENVGLARRSQPFSNSLCFLLKNQFLEIKKPAVVKTMAGEVGVAMPTS